MAINVNTVYTTVLSIINKEQRGYLTPDEFNKLAVQVQLEIFEKFFEDYNQFLRMPKTDVEFASRMDHTMEEFQVFEKTGPSITIPSTSQQTNNVYNQPSDLHRFGSATFNKGLNSPSIEILSNRDYNQIKLSPLTQPTNNFPVAKYQQDKLTVFPSAAPYASSDITFNYIRKPSDVRWGYVLGSLGQYIYDPTVFEASKLAQGNLSAQTNFGTSTSAAGTFVLQQGVGFTYTSSTGGTGTNAVISVNVVGTGTVTLDSTNTSLIVQAGSFSGFNVGDTLTIPTNAFGSNYPTSPIVITLASNNLMGATGQGSLQFEISESQQTDSVLGILKYAGIIIKDPTIIQAAGGLQNLEEQNAKK